MARRGVAVRMNIAILFPTPEHLGSRKLQSSSEGPRSGTAWVLCVDDSHLRQREACYDRDAVQLCVAEPRSVSDGIKR